MNEESFYSLSRRDCWECLLPAPADPVFLRGTPVGGLAVESMVVRGGSCFRIPDKVGGPAPKGGRRAAQASGPGLALTLTL